ncbi:MAG: hypothetical protein ACD_64C00338G0003 [uncultured bacterium]|nr:MAG: hypothetical protein ACD_64C00338G0003 [uncultured bacterium]
MKIAMMFPGYQSQFVGMGKELYDEHRIVQELFEQASSCLDINFVKLCFASSDADLATTRNAYTSTFLVSASLFELLKQKGVQPDVVAGFNHGVYAALFAAGGLSLPDGLYLLSKFALFYDEAQKDGKFLAIHVSGVEHEQMQAICMQASTLDEKAFISIYEIPMQHVIAGNTHAVERVRDMVSALSDEKKISIEPLDIAVGLHSELIDPVIDQFKIYLNKVDFHDLSVPMIESLAGKKVTSGKDVHEQILVRINSPIMWPVVMKQLARYDLIIEIGPGTVLSKWFKQLYPDKEVMAINKPKDIEAVLARVKPQAEAPATNS